MTNEFSIKRTFLYTVIATLVLAAVMGIYVLLAGRFGQTEGKILLTTVVISFFGMMSLAGTAAHEKGPDRWAWSVPGIALGVAGLVLYVLAIWGDWWRYELAAKWLVILGIASFCFAHISVLSLVSLEDRVRPLFYAAVASIAALAMLISGMILGGHAEAWHFRVAGVLGILDVCLTLCVPIASRLSRKELAAGATETYRQIELCCPRCGQRGTYTLGKIACRACALGLRIEID
jgi:hypothetical protein